MLRSEVREVIAALDAVGVGSVCAGGAARDALLGITPKDYDVILLGSGGEEVLRKVVCVAHDLDEEVLVDVFHGVGSDGDHQCEFVVKLHFLSGLVIDIIQNAENGRGFVFTPEEACSKFDYNICAAYFDANGNAVPSKDYSTIVRPLHPHANARRLVYLLEKFGQIYNFGVILDIIGYNWLSSNLADGDVYTRYVTNIEFPSEPLED